MEAPLLPGFQSDLIFSGFDNQYRLDLHETIFNLIWFGDGRWSWDDIYNMPIFLRRYWVNRVSGIIKDREEASKARESRSKSKSSNVPNRINKRRR